MIILTLYTTYLFLVTIHVYRYCMRPLVTVTCCMYPSCSEYGYQAISKHGPWRGGYLTVKRIASCHPWQKKRIDFVP